MSLDQELDNETRSNDQETNKLRDVLIDLHKKMPEESASDNGPSSEDITDTDRNYESDDENSDTAIKVNIGNKSVTKTKEDMHRGAIAADSPQRKDYKPKRVKIAPASKDFSNPRNNSNDPEALKASGASTNRHTNTYAHVPNNLAHSDQHSDVGNIYHQQKDGSKTLEIYNNNSH